MAVLDTTFKQAVEMKASDVHVTPGEPFIVRQCGCLRKLNGEALVADKCRELILEILDSAAAGAVCRGPAA